MLLPKIVASAIVALSLALPQFPMEIERGTVDDDVAITSRYVDVATNGTNECSVVFDESNFQAAAGRASTDRIYIRSSVLRKFILLHEIAHCYDVDPAPTGVDPIEWREYLADDFAVTELYANGEISKNEIQDISRIRRKSPLSFARIPTEEVGPLIEDTPSTSGTKDRLLAARAFRFTHLGLSTSSVGMH